MRALLSCSNKTGIVEFARGLVDLGYEIVSTGGTREVLAAADLPVSAVSDVTRFPEVLDGRVKTLHPAIHGGLLARVDDPEHVRQLAEHDITPIDVVAVNLYPFAEAVQDPNVPFQQAIEEIDIGGPAMLRAAAKNHASIVVVTDPQDYAETLRQMNAGPVDPSRRRSLAAKAFAHVAAYDALVAAFLAGESADSFFSDELALGLRRARLLRYGENPHQQAAAYRWLRPGASPLGILDAEQLSGPELSFNNLLDSDAAWIATGIASAPTAAIVKHGIPCGLATRDKITPAFAVALAGDPVSAFGGVAALNRPVDDALAHRLSEAHFDIVLAPAFAPAAIAHLRRRKRLRLLQLAAPRVATNGTSEVDLRVISGGLLVQSSDTLADDPTEWSVVTERRPTPAEQRDLDYAWRAARLVKSNGIVLVKEQAVTGVGSGQPNRLESVAIAARRAGQGAAGCALASDAFFPFADGIDAAAAIGVTAVVQPGGAIRDSEVIAAANAAGITMLFTGIRHFRH